MFNDDYMIKVCIDQREKMKRNEQKRSVSGYGHGRVSSEARPCAWLQNENCFIFATSAIHTGVSLCRHGRVSGHRLNLFHFSRARCLVGDTGVSVLHTGVPNMAHGRVA